VGRAIQVVADTTVFLRWFLYEKISRSARDALHSADTIGVSAISCWEVAMLVAKGRVQLGEPPLAWLQAAISAPRWEVMPLTVNAAVTANLLTDFESHDPADQMIVATAMDLAWPLVTSDRAMRRYSEVETIW
jgi:PIN domain nuclease of toxin-antitoxin system